MVQCDTLARLRVSGKPNNLFVDLYLPIEAWKALIKELNGNRLTVALRFEGEDGTSILEA